MKLFLKSSLNVWQISNPNPNVRVKLTIQKYALTFTHNLRTHLKTHIGEKSKQILRGSAIHKYELGLTHDLKTHSGEKLVKRKVKTDFMGQHHP